MAHRERIIFCLSLEDQVLDQMLFSSTLAAEVKSSFVNSSKPGWSPLPAGFNLFYQTFSLDDVVSIDKMAWDWTMPDWVILCYFHQRFGHWPQRLRDIVWRRFCQVVGPDCRIRLPSGEVLSQQIWGIMKSGWLLTIGLNSASQVYQHYLAEIRSRSLPKKLWSYGDDLIMQKPTQEYLMHLSMTGCIVKHVLPKAEFVGLEFKAGGVLQPLYGKKHEFRLAYADPHLMPAIAIGLCAWYALAEDRSSIQKLYSYSRYSRQVYYWWALGLCDLDVKYII